MISTAVRSAILLLAVAALAGCGPETNSRYGDAYWDPWTTKDTFDPVEAPEFSVEFVDTNDDEEEIYEARISLDASATYERLYSHSWGFVRGTKERGTIAPLGGDDISLTFLEDPDDPGNDERLVATTPGHYRIVFVGETDGPLGKVTIRFDDMTFALPGCPTTFDYYGDYIDDTLETCSGCHETGDASTALDLPDNNANSRRSNFLTYIANNTVDDSNDTLPQWVNNPNHLGRGTLPADSDDYRNFAEFIEILETIKADNGGNLTTNNNGDTVPDAYCIAKPGGFSFTQE